MIGRGISGLPDCDIAQTLRRIPPFRHIARHPPHRGDLTAHGGTAD
jgi:hypothetical protein